MNHKIVMSGASGYVGAKVYSDLKQNNFQITGLYHHHQFYPDLVQADITDSPTINQLLNNLKPSIIIHVASVSRSNDAKNNPERTERLNIEGTRNLVNWASDNKGKLIYISTFSCFEPTNKLGETKFAAENLTKTLEQYVIIRPSMIVGVSPNQTNNSAFNMLLQKHLRHEMIQADSSWQFEATYLQHLSETIQTIVNSEKINQVMIPLVASGVTTQYQLAQDIFAPFGAKVEELVTGRTLPLPTIDFNQYEKLGLKQYQYSEVIANIQTELKELNSHV